MRSTCKGGRKASFLNAFRPPLFIANPVISLCHLTEVPTKDELREIENAGCQYYLANDLDEFIKWFKYNFLT